MAPHNSLVGTGVFFILFGGTRAEKGWEPLQYRSIPESDTFQQSLVQTTKHFFHLNVKNRKSNYELDRLFAAICICSKAMRNCFFYAITSYA